MGDNSTSQDQDYTYSNITTGYNNYSKITTGSYNYSNITTGYNNYSNITSGYYNYSNISSEYEDYQKPDLFVVVITWIITCIGLPLTLIAIYCLYSEVKNDHVAPIYVINLLISDLVQLCCMIIMVAPHEDSIGFIISDLLYNYCLAVSVGFMVCVALERYLFIACPLWYHFRRTIRFCILVGVVVWVLLLFMFFAFILVKPGIFLPFLLLPLPLFVFFLGGTLKALSTSTVPSDEKRRILGVLVLVLLIYTLLFLPRIINSLIHTFDFYILSLVLIRLSPLADLVLYVFMRKGTVDKLLASLCCCRKDRTDDSKHIA